MGEMTTGPEGGIAAMEGHCGDGDNGDGDDYDYGDSLYCDYGDDDDNVMVMIAIYCDDVVEMGMRQQVL